MRNILYIVFFLFVSISAGIPDARQGHKSCPDIYSLVLEITEIMDKGDTHSDYEDGIDLTSLASSFFPCSMIATDTQKQFYYDKICIIFQPPR